MVRVVQWATGGVGKAAIEAVQAHPELDLAGCFVYSETKRGKDVGDILGTQHVGVTATDDVEDILALDADVVVYAPLIPNAGEVARILRSGKNVVTPVGWFYPSERDAELVRACVDGGVTLHGIGINPGGTTDLYPLVLSAMSSKVTFVRAEEFSDMRSYDAPRVLREVMGFGGTFEQARDSPMLGLLTGGFTQSVRMCLDTLGFADAPIQTSHEIAVAAAAIESPLGIIEPGQVAGQRFVWDAMVGDQPVVRIAVNWLMGEQNLEPAWEFGPDGERYEIEIKGDPDTFVTIRGWQPASIAEGLKRNPGIVATANHCVNSIPYVCAAAPGITSSLDLPVVAGRAHPEVGAPRG
ncbi:hypothetical protein [Haloechinothrix sp. LS1_15]|uniref:NAD(P)H-dependent amine dehydrogenase family protein n=1 Tax=Haloechinothrix sp. LS1_15 TaxID=2652248 RepID=UPI0029466D07|nr:hypothetical protein [Haloechinothrix sp. LS1_15]MDV6013942.1 dihydrodipicolinate reductase [Haloechinothrix sp. LS1_15]